MIAALFWASLAILVFTYFLFPGLILLRGWLRPRPYREGNRIPAVSVLIAAYNESRDITRRIENLLAQDYPENCLEVLIASDGSTDGTDEVVGRFADPRVKLLSLPRRGKGPALNAAAQAAAGEVLVFSDANTSFAAGALRALIRPFSDPQVGGVAGNQVYVRGDTPSLTADGEHMYWNFDRLLKEFQSRAGSVTSATGAIYAVRRCLYQPIPENAMDDFIVSTSVVAQNHRLVFAADAVALEPVAVREEVEYSRKVRVMTQGLRGVLVMRHLLNPLRYGFYSLQLFWHKVLRRAMAFPLLVLLGTSPLLWHGGLLYQAITLAQVLFLAASLLGWTLRWTFVGRLKLMTFPYYFCMVHFAALVAILRTLTGRKIRRWEPERHQFHTGDKDYARAPRVATQ
jgi:cellulose synthase/poly-beta-1,6-N-acetylglucosamine synthase-like glycosyltransferase